MNYKQLENELNEKCWNRDVTVQLLKATPERPDRIIINVDGTTFALIFKDDDNDALLNFPNLRHPSIQELPANFADPILWFVSCNSWKEMADKPKSVSLTNQQAKMVDEALEQWILADKEKHHGKLLTNDELYKSNMIRKQLESSFDLNNKEDSK